MSGKDHWSWKEFGNAVGLSLGVTTVQIAWAMLIGCLLFPGRPPSEVYLRLNQWDSVHYADIAARGYHLPVGPIQPQDVHSDRANVAFFPAYPLFVRGVQKLSGFSTQVSLLVFSQLACFLFWTQLFLLVQLWGRSSKDCFKLALRICLFPSAFYLVAGYSESLFMASLIGLILWVQWVPGEGASSKAGWGVAAVQGTILSATRFVGIPLASYPFIDILSRTRTRSSWVSAISLSLFASFGALVFFLYCYFRFGRWDLYIQLQQLGWGNQPKYWALVDPWSYLPKFFYEDTVNSVCKLSNAFVILYTIRLIYRWGCRSLDQLPLLFAAFCLFFVSLSGKANYGMDSMIRYNLPVFILLILYQARFGNFEKPFHRGVGFFLIVLQSWLTLLFLKGGWVA